MSSFIDLLKGRTQKYIKRIPKAGGGYRYIYKEHHKGGVGAQEHMKEGAAFKLTFGGQEGHFHIVKAQGDKITVKHDELHGPDHAGVEMTKAELSALLTREHRPALEADAKKKRERVERMKRETPRHIGLKQAERLAKEAEARLGEERKPQRSEGYGTDEFGQSNYERHGGLLDQAAERAGVPVSRNNVGRSADGRIVRVNTPQVPIDSPAGIRKIFKEITRAQVQFIQNRAIEWLAANSGDSPAEIREHIEHIAEINQANAAQKYKDAAAALSEVASATVNNRGRVDKQQGTIKALEIIAEARKIGKQAPTPAPTPAPNNFETMPEGEALTQEIKRLESALKEPHPAEDARATPKNAPYQHLSPTQRLAIDRGYLLRPQTEKERALLAELKYVREQQIDPSPALRNLIFEEYSRAFPDFGGKTAFDQIFEQGMGYEPYTLKHTQASRTDIDDKKLTAHIRNKLLYHGAANRAGSAAVTYIDQMRKIELYAADALEYSSTDKQRAAVNELVQQARQKALKYIEDFSEGRPLSRARADLFKLEDNIKKDLDITRKLRALRDKHIKETKRALTKLKTAENKQTSTPAPTPTPTPTPAPDNFETMPEGERIANKASEAIERVKAHINELRNQHSVSLSEDDALEIDEQILDAQLTLRKLEREELKARRAAAKEQAPKAQPIETPKPEPVKAAPAPEPEPAPAGTKRINLTLTNSNQQNAFWTITGAKGVKARKITHREYELTARPQDFENALADLENAIKWEESGRGGRQRMNPTRIKQMRTLSNKMKRAVKNAPLTPEEAQKPSEPTTPPPAKEINLTNWLQDAPQRTPAQEEAPKTPREQPIEPPKPEPVKVAPAPAPEPVKAAPVYAHAQNTRRIVDRALSSKPTGVDLNDARAVLPNIGDLKLMLSEKGRLKRAKMDLAREFNRPNFLGHFNPEDDIDRALDRYLNGPYVEIEQNRLRDIEKGFKIALRDARGEELEQVKEEIRRFWREWGGAYVRLHGELVTERTQGEALRKIRPLIQKGSLTPQINQMLDRLEDIIDQRPVTSNDPARWIFFQETNKATRDNPRQTFREHLAETAPAPAQEEAPKTPREQLIETAREATAPAPEPVQAQNALPHELAHEPRMIDFKRTTARNAIYDIIALIDERAGTPSNDHRSLTALTAHLSAKKIADKPSAFSYWGYRQREAGESARSNPNAAAFERHLSKKPSHLGRKVNASDIAEFTRAHLGIERVNDLKGKENQVKKIAARFARDSFTEALRVGEEARNEAFAQIIDKGSEYFDAAPNYLKKLIANLERNTEEMSTNPQASQEIQSVIPLAKRALTHYQKRAEKIKSQPFSKAEFLEGLKTSTNSRHLVQGEPRGVAVKKRTEALVYEAINQELNNLIEQHKKTEATPEPTPIDHSLIEALEQGPLKQLKKPFKQEEADA